MSHLYDCKFILNEGKIGITIQNLTNGIVVAILSIANLDYF